MPRTSRIPAAILTLALVVAGLMAYIGTHPMPLPPCPTEDSVSCHWDAQQQGNGHGRSFTVDEHGTRTYTS